MWMRKYIALCLALLLLVASGVGVAVPVSAANDSGWIELLEYSSVLDNGENWFTIKGTSGSVTIPIQGERRLRKIDMLLWNPTGQRPTSASVTASGSTTTLNVLQIGGNMCRVVGYLPYTWYESVTVDFKKSTTTSQTYEVLSCKVTSLGVQDFVCDASVFVDGKTYSISQTISFVGETLAEDVSHLKQIRIDVKDWQKYDSLTIWGSAEQLSIDSIRASVFTSGLPMEINYFQCNDAGEYSGHYFIDDGTGQSYSVPFYGKYLFCVFIDLSGVDRTLAEPLYLYLTGRRNSICDPTFTCQYVNGHVFTADTSGVSWWARFESFMSTSFTNLRSAISTGFSNVGTWISKQTATLKTELVGIWQEIEDGFAGLPSLFERYFGQDVPEANDFAQEAESHKSELDQMNGKIEAVTKPPVEDIKTDIGSYIDSEDNATVTGAFQSLANNPLILTMMMITLTVALMGYILFGKR